MASTAVELPRSVVLKHDPYRRRPCVEFRLIYDGVLLGGSRTDTRSVHKHAIRRVFHPQLKRLWNTHPLLNEWISREVHDPIGGRQVSVSILEQIANRYKLGKYRFAPLAMEKSELACSIDVLFLRYDQPGQTLLQSGVAVEKPPLLKKRSQPRDRKCPPKSGTSFIGPPSALKFWRISRE